MRVRGAKFSGVESISEVAELSHRLLALRGYGWSSHISGTDIFWHNKLLGISQWDRPRPSPPQQVVAQGTTWHRAHIGNRYYWHSATTMESRWTTPMPDVQMPDSLFAADVLVRDIKPGAILCLSDSTLMAGCFALAAYWGLLEAT